MLNVREERTPISSAKPFQRLLRCRRRLRSCRQHDAPVCGGEPAGASRSVTVAVRAGSGRHVGRLIRTESDCTHRKTVLRALAPLVATAVPSLNPHLNLNLMQHPRAFFLSPTGGEDQGEGLWSGSFW